MRGRRPLKSALMRKSDVGEISKCQDIKIFIYASGINTNVPPSSKVDKPIQNTSTDSLCSICSSHYCSEGTSYKSTRPYFRGWQHWKHLCQVHPLFMMCIDLRFRKTFGHLAAVHDDTTASNKSYQYAHQTPH
jgi:hypothetical protein